MHVAPAAEKTRSTPAEEAGAAKYCLTILASAGHLLSFACHHESTLTSRDGSSGSNRYCSSLSSRVAGAAGDASFLTRLPISPPSEQTLPCFFGGSADLPAPPPAPRRRLACPQSKALVGVRFRPPVPCALTGGVAVGCVPALLREGIPYRRRLVELFAVHVRENPIPKLSETVLKPPSLPHYRHGAAPSRHNARSPVISSSCPSQTRPKRFQVVNNLLTALVNRL